MTVPQYQLGEHIIAFWVEGNEVKWHFQVVEGLKNNTPTVSYMVHTDPKGKSWTYPESADVLQTSCDEIQAVNVKVQYLCSVCIWCGIVANELIDQINFIIKDY